MTVTYGFYNSKNHDRKYNAKQLSNLFEGILNDGVFASIGTSLVVEAAGGMVVNVGVGRAWFKNTWIDNDAVLPLTIGPADLVLNRIDAVVVEVNKSEDVRANSIKVLKGASGANPARPALLNTETIAQYALCYILVSAGVTTITQDKITNTVGTEECPFITGILQTMTVEGVSTILEYEFNQWFSGVKGQLSGDVAGNLMNQINDIKDDINFLDNDKLGGSNLLTLSSYQSLAGNVNAQFNCAAFCPSLVGEFDTKKIQLGFQIAKYLVDYCSDITLTGPEINLLSLKNTWWDICKDATCRNILTRSASFITKIKAIPFANYVFYTWTTPETFLNEVNLTYSTGFKSIDELKTNKATMQQLMNNDYFCKQIGFNLDLEKIFFGENGEKITLLKGSGNFIVPQDVYALHYSLVSAGGGGTGNQGNILSGSMYVTPGQSIAYSVPNGTSNATINHTTFGALTTSTGAKISDTNAGVLGRATPSGAGVGGVGYGAGGQGGAGPLGGGGNLFLGSDMKVTGAGVKNDVVIINFVDTIIKVSSYRDAKRLTTVLLQKATELNIFGGAGGGGSGGGNYYNPGGAGGAGGGGYGGAGGPEGTRNTNANSTLGAGGQLGFAGASGALGGAGAASWSAAGVSGTGSHGIVFLMW